MVSPSQFLPIGPFCLGITIDVYCLNLTSKSVAPSTGLFSQQMRHSTLIGGVQDVCLIGWNHYLDGFVSSFNNRSIWYNFGPLSIFTFLPDLYVFSKYNTSQRTSTTKLFR